MQKYLRGGKLFIMGSTKVLQTGQLPDTIETVYWQWLSSSVCVHSIYCKYMKLSLQIILFKNTQAFFQNR